MKPPRCIEASRKPGAHSRVRAPAIGALSNIFTDYPNNKTFILSHAQIVMVVVHIRCVSSYTYISSMCVAYFGPKLLPKSLALSSSFFYVYNIVTITGHGNCLLTDGMITFKLKRTHATCGCECVINLVLKATLVLDARF